MDKYTLDRFDEGFGVLLKFPAEEEQLLIPQEELQGLKQGNILLVQKDGEGYSFTPLEEETEDMKSKVNALINKLKDK